ncbi:pyroglutamyl-peptidase I [Ilyobacter polytropus]|uniref:Pyrrolidone-carboxylate peptidase n=1 Tax=Ilyobacter polytropus (strain ATCC 51220 / DSM 2926 / LMG 16218 / CuHBu1) TaxID=572544 RepID=E3H783_ILYPC|nr:pyroglutamyl-peptidase I [Ilyobacter polytropus]ADO82564.1 pyrrolidone-carboxylate peptidase [Ilyobacter polytropus DSM 2926]
MRVLITGFDPFGGEKINPAWEAIKLLPDTIESIEVIKLEIPTVFKKSIDVLMSGIEKHKPDAVICVGQAGGRYEISMERIAINLDDARIKDNEGNQPIDEKVYPDGDSAYFSNLPIKAMTEAIKSTGIPASVSNTAGTFVCNHIMYGLLYHIEKSNVAKKGGFIHVPYIPQQVIGKKNLPSMGLDIISQGLEAAISAIGKNEKDLEISGGREF